MNGFSRRQFGGLALAAIGVSAVGLSGLPGQRAVAAVDKAQIEELLGKMTLEQKIGQLFIAVGYGSTARDTDSKMVAANQKASGVDTTAEMIEKFLPGGLIYFAWTNSVQSPEQTLKLSNEVQAIAKKAGIPELIIGTDEEEGVVSRMPQPSTQFPGSMALGATRDADLAYKASVITGRELLAVGINQDYAPDSDVNNNPANPVIGVRSFGGDAGIVSEMVKAQVKGYQSSNVSSTVKHFPGHGDTATDSHLGLPVISHTRAQLDTIDLPPFKGAIAAGVDSIMTAHIVVPALDDTKLPDKEGKPSDVPNVPATLSKKILTGLLRNELGFDGVIVTDSLAMEGVLKLFTNDRVPVEALKAGADQMLMPPSMTEAVSGVKAAVASGELTEERINQSVRRILTQKAKRGILGAKPASAAKLPALVNTRAANLQAERTANASITMLRNADNVLPMKPGTKVLVTGYGDAKQLGEVAGELEDAGLKAEAFELDDFTAADGQKVVDKAKDFDAIVYLTSTSALEPKKNQMDAFNVVIGSGVPSTKPATTRQAAPAAQSGAGKPIIHLMLRNPYETAFITPVNATLALYSWAPVSLHAAARVIAGKVNPSGKLPVAVPTADGKGTLYPLGYGLRFADVTSPSPTEPTPTEPAPTTPAPSSSAPTSPSQPAPSQPGDPGQPGRPLPSTGR